MNRTLPGFLFLITIAIGLSSIATADEVLLFNSSFEDNTDWMTFGNALFPVFADPNNPLTPDVANSGKHVARLFGRFTGDLNVNGLYQQFPAEQGDRFEIDAFSFIDSDDPLIGNGVPDSNWVVMKIAFFDSSGFEIGGFEGTIADGTFPQNQWIDNPSVTGVAPPDTVLVGAYILFLQPGLDAGSVFVDDVYFAKLDTPPTTIVVPDSFVVTRGTNVAGGVTELAESDDQYLIMNPQFMMRRYQNVFTVDATAPTDEPSAFEFSLEARVLNFVGTVDQKIELFNYDTGQYETVDNRLATATDSVVTVTPAGDSTRFVETETGAMRARISYQNSLPYWSFQTANLFFPFRTSVDHISWSVIP